jgi:hypothetical protein
LSQSYEKAAEFPAYNFQPCPSHALSVSPKVLARLGEGKSADWHEGKAAALLCIEIGLRKDGILPALLMQNHIAEQSTAIAELEAKLADEKLLNKEYRARILSFHAEPEHEAA